MQSLDITEAYIDLSSPILISNDGQNIADTNYWDSDRAKKGMCYLSKNAGALRLLVPQILADRCMREMPTGHQVSIEVSITSPTCIDIVFQDGSTTPFCVMLDRINIDHALTPETSIPFTVWMPQGKILSFTAKVANIPPFPVMRVAPADMERVLRNLMRGDIAPTIRP